MTRGVRERHDDHRAFYDGWLFKFGSRLCLGLVVVLVFLTLAQCTVQKPEAPSWTTHFTVPMVNRVFEMQELVNRADQEGLDMDDEGNITFTIDEDLDTVYISEEHLQTPALTVVAQEPFNTVIPGYLIDVPAQTIEFSQTVALAETDRIDSAAVTNGSVAFAIVNATNLNNALVTLTVPDFVDAEGESLSQQYTINARDTGAVSIELNQYILAPTDHSVPQNLQVNVEIDIPAQVVDVFVTDEFEVEAQISELSFGSVTGVFSAVDASFDDINVDVDVPEGFEGIQLTATELTLEIANGIDLPGALDLHLSGSHGKTVDFEDDIAASGGLATAISEITLTTDFLSPIPDTIYASGTATFGDGVTVGTIRAGDFVAGQVHIVAPMQMIIQQSTIDADLQSEDIDQNDIDKITDHVTEAGFHYTVLNQLPVGATLEIFMGGDSATVYSNPQVTIGPISVDASGALATGLESSGEITLTNDDVRILENATVWIGPRLTLHSSNGQEVSLTASDSLTVVGYIDVEYFVDGEL